MHVSDMPIKMPRGQVLLPIELAELRNLVQLCIDFERQVNVQYDDYFIYLTYQQTYVERGRCVRGGGLHSDSVQGPRINPKIKIEHSYLWTDADPPVFFVQPFGSGHRRPATPSAGRGGPGEPTRTPRAHPRELGASCRHLLPFALCPC